MSLTDDFIFQKQYMVHVEGSGGEDYPRGNCYSFKWYHYSL